MAHLPFTHLPVRGADWRQRQEARSSSRAGWDSLMMAALPSADFYSSPLWMASNADFPFMAVIKVPL